jgi:hypothetical protein
MLVAAISAEGWVLIVGAVGVVVTNVTQLVLQHKQACRTAAKLGEMAAVGEKSLQLSNGQMGAQKSQFAAVTRVLAATTAGTPNGPADAAAAERAAADLAEHNRQEKLSKGIVEVVKEENGKHLLQ